MSDTYRVIIKDALLNIGATDINSEPTDTENEYCLRILKDMLANWSSDGLMIPFETELSLVLSESQREFVISANEESDFNSPPFEKLAYARYRRASNDTASYLERVSVNDFSLSQTENTSYLGYPYSYKYESRGDPSVYYFTMNYLGLEGDILSLGGKMALNQEIALDDVMMLPPEYRAAIKFNLSKWVAEGFQVQASPLVMQMAQKTLNTISKKNIDVSSQPTRPELTWSNYRNRNGRW